MPFEIFSDFGMEVGIDFTVMPFFSSAIALVPFYIFSDDFRKQFLCRRLTLGGFPKQHICLRLRYKNIVFQ